MNAAITSLSIESPRTLLLAALLSIAIVATGLWRRPEIPRIARVLALLGICLLCLAAAAVVWSRPIASDVLVMVDLSPSTRGALYRHPESLRQRIAQLLGGVRHQVRYFADAVTAIPPDGNPLPDLPTQQTTFQPPPAAAILLFSDARFNLPATATPTYVVVDPLLDAPGDAAIHRLELRDGAVALTVTNPANTPRALGLTPAATGILPAIPPGTTILTVPTPPPQTDLTARIDSDDLWPENDALTLHLPAPALSERWWVSARAAPSSQWRAFDPASLPTSREAYLAPSIIALDNLPATEFSEERLRALHQYVRDLGGSLLVLGGDHAFAAGSYPGTILESLSPLSSSPPSPTVHWVLLADASGSMAGSDSSSSPWDRARRAMLALLPHLPPEDLLTIGSFAADVRWWSRGSSAAETARLSLPPPDVYPNGPTNLESALKRLIVESNGGMPIELLLMTDAETDLKNPAELEQELKSKNIRLNLLAIGPGGPALAPLRQLVAASGGKLVHEANPASWPAAARRLLSMASPKRLLVEDVTLEYSDDLQALPSRRITLSNRTWLKPGAIRLAFAARPNGSPTPAPLAARWTVGAGGRVLAAGFSPNAEELESMARLIGQPPRDPRLRITWELGRVVRVQIDAADEIHPLNALNLTLQLSPRASDTLPSAFSIPQTGPGRYALEFPAPRHPAIASIRENDRLLDRRAIAGRYPPEFDAVGNDAGNMRELANRTGGGVIPPNQVSPIPFRFPTRRVPISPTLALAGAASLGLALILWRRG